MSLETQLISTLIEHLNSTNYERHGVLHSPKKTAANKQKATAKLSQLCHEHAHSSIIVCHFLGALVNGKRN
eukprot:scaffold82482_cov33-Prasinocladus_malaysianus.AAC.1